MAYTVTRSNGTTFQVAEAAINTSETSIPLLGQNVTNYGQPMANALVRMLENFSNVTDPANPSVGQLWWDTANGQMRVRTVGATWDNMVKYNSSNHVVPIANGANDLGLSGTRWRTVFSQTFESGGADLAERYETDAVYEEGTVVKIGGEKEITTTTEANDTDVFGVISIRPGLALNTSIDDVTMHPYVAIAGRVPVRVTGTVKKGQRLVTSMIPGVAMAADTAAITSFMVVGRALQDKTTEEEGLVLTTVGSK